MSLVPGLRVVRGPNWEWGNQDDGPGHLGTVVALGKSEGNQPPLTVYVRWDRGLQGDYRIGFNGAYDLRLFDNASVGDCHPETRCNKCQKCPIRGVRWEGKDLASYNLCSKCYHEGSRHLDHQFYRIVVPGAKGVLMPRRISSERTEVKGLFPGAKVRKGSDLELDANDERLRCQGTVLSLCEWQLGYTNTGALVLWPPPTETTYRLGYEGKVDLKTKEPGSGGFFYLDHLLILGKEIEMESVEGLVVGDHVTVAMERSLLEALQQGHGDWAAGMAEDIGHVGLIRGITSDQDVVVEYPQQCRRWIFHPGAVTKLAKYRVGDAVTIVTERIQALKLQTRRAILTRQLDECIGKPATVLEVGEAGQYRIRLDDSDLRTHWVSAILLMSPSESRPMDRTFSPSNLSSEERASSGGENKHEVIQAVSQRIGLDDRPNNSGTLVAAAATGNIQTVRDMLEARPELVDEMLNFKTALHLAAYGGFMETVQLLVGAQAGLDIQDEDGDTALMLAINGNQPVILDYLLEQGANIDIVNQDQRSALHLAVTRNFVDCVEVLLRHGCDVNKQDKVGDTALHDALSGQNNEILAALIAALTADFTLTNQRGFNALQWAAFKGNQFGVNRICLRQPDLAKVSNADGFTPLHLAAMKDFPDITRILLVKGNADANVYTASRQTPLLLAVRAGYVEVVEVLLTLGAADVNLPDRDGDTSLHIAVLRLVGGLDVTDSITLQKIYAKIPVQSVASTALAFTCLLVESNADLHHVNISGSTPLDLVPDEQIHVVLRHFIPQSSPGRELESSQRASAPTQDTPAERENVRRQREKLQQLSHDASRPALDNKERTQRESAQKDNSGVRNVTKESESKLEPEHVRRQRLKERQFQPGPDGSSFGSQTPQEDGRSAMSGREVGEHVAQQQRKELLLRPPLEGTSHPSSPCPPSDVVDASLLPSHVSNLTLTSPRLPLPTTPMGEGAPLPSPSPSPSTRSPNLAHCRMSGCGRVADVQFLPCSHINVCRQCSECFKLCIQCKKPIEGAVECGRLDPPLSNTDPAMGQQTPVRSEVWSEVRSEVQSKTEGVRRRLVESDQEGASLTRSILIQKNQKLAEQVECPICLDRCKEYVFMCGHSLCEECYINSVECPFCRKPIQKAIKMF